MVEPFKSRVNTNVVPLAQRVEGPGIGRGLAAIGDALGDAVARDEQVRNRIDEAEYDLKVQDEALAGRTALLDLQARYGEEIAQARLAPPDSIGGFASGLAERFQQEWQGIVRKATTRGAQDSLSQQAASLQASLRMQGQEVEVRTRFDRTNAQAKLSATTYMNGGRAIAAGAAGDAQDQLETKSFADWLETVAPVVGIDRAQAMYREARGGRIEQRGLGLIEAKNFAAARAIADSEEANALWSPDARDQYLRRIAAAEHSEDAARKAEAAVQLRETKEKIAARRAELDTGAGTPSDWDELARWEQAVGNESGVVTARAKGAEMQAVQGARDLTLPEMDREIASLERARTGKGGLSVAQASRLAGLTTLRSQSANRLNDSGGALAQYAYATGRALPPLDPANPASLRARGQLATAAAIRYGRNVVEPITAAELPGFKDLASGTPQQRLEAADRLQAFGDPRAIAGAARQMAGADDGQFRRAALVRSQEVRRDILRGDATLQANKHLWNEAQAQKDFGAWYGRTLTLIGGEMRSDVYQAARALYAQRATDGGETKYNPGRFAEAVEAVLGKSNGTTGGTIRANGGRGDLVLVPQGVPRATFLRGFTSAMPDDFARASGGDLPVWNDSGKVLTRSELTGAVPTMVGEGVYGFRAPNGKLIGSKRQPGAPYLVDYSRLTAR